MSCSKTPNPCLLLLWHKTGENPGITKIEQAEQWLQAEDKKSVKPSERRGLEFYTLN